MNYKLVYGQNSVATSAKKRIDDDSEEMKEFRYKMEKVFIKDISNEMVWNHIDSEKPFPKNGIWQYYKTSYKHDDLFEVSCLILIGITSLAMENEEPKYTCAFDYSRLYQAVKDSFNAISGAA